VTHEIRSISPQRLARVSAIVLGGITLLISLLVLPMFLLAPFPENSPNEPPKLLILLVLIMYPLFGALWGWIAGQISARIYNAVARRFGGIQLVLAPIEQNST
jgi:hypothetical protein